MSEKIGVRFQEQEYDALDGLLDDAANLASVELRKSDADAYTTIREQMWEQDTRQTNTASLSEDHWYRALDLIDEELDKQPLTHEQQLAQWELQTLVGRIRSSLSGN